MSTWLWWSSGKDSAWALQRLREEGVEVTALVTTVNRRFHRVAMHGVRETLLEAQAEAAGLPLRRVPIPHPCSNAEYEGAVGLLLHQAREAGVTRMAFGDLFLEDIRAYREALLEGTGIEPLFPLWGRDTAMLAREMQAGGLRAVVTCVDPRALPADRAGRAWDADFLCALPEGVDPCGENGEFHTFAWASPVFSAPLDVSPGPVVEREGFVFADLHPGRGLAPSP